MASSSIVIKVKFGETLRRFSASIDDKKLALDVVALREKIRTLFNFNPDVGFTLTYIDEDGDSVTLADDDDIHDVVRQSLNPLRLTVTLTKSTPTVPTQTRTSTPITSQVPHLPSGPISDFLNTMPAPLSGFLKSMPEPFRGQLTNLPLQLASKASASNTPVISELAESLTAAYLNQVSGSTTAPNALPATMAEYLKQVHGSKTAPRAQPPTTQAESSNSNSKNKEKVEKVSSEGVKLKVVQPPKAIDLNHPYFDYDSFPSAVEGQNGKSGENDTAEDVEKNKDSGSSSGWSTGVPNLTSQCPFSGMPLGPLPGEWGPPHHPSRGHGHWKRYGHGNGIGSLVFHRGVRCDGCGVHPITGPRYKSKVKEDYDLCSDCFTGMGNVSDYVRMDRPTNSVRHHMGFRGFHDPSVRFPSPGLPHAMRGPGSRGPRCKLDSRFILDVNVLDGTIVAPLTSFTKIWKMRNNGTIVWPRGSQLHWIGGDRLSNNVAVDVEIPDDGLAVEKEIDVAVEFSAPELPGRYISYWRMASPSGQKFGQRVWVLIQVDSSMKDLGAGQSQSQSQPSPINLNMAPIALTMPGLTIGGHVLGDNVMLKSPAPNNPSANQDMNFPINDTLIVGNADVSTTTTTIPTAPVAPTVFRAAEVENALGIFPTVEVSYPDVDNSEVVPPVTAEVAGSGSGSVSGGEDKEESLVEELVAMGFKQLDLNKEILRMNNYDLEKSVDDLCGVSEWDPMLEELQEMGFVDEEANRRLLKKNNGSIKRVVMDLINGERA